MNSMKILFVEDAMEQQEAFKDSVEVFNEKSDLNVEYEIVGSVPCAIDKIDGSYDGAIIDLRLGDDEDGGNKIVRQLGDSFTRIPIVFVTAFPDSVIDHTSIVKTRSRDKDTYESDLLLFREIFDTGLTRIMGGRGIIEKTLTEVYLNNLLPQMEAWRSYGKEDSERTEKALLRYTLNHLLQLLEEEEERSFPEEVFPEEVYLYPPVLNRITTGSIVTADDKWFAVLSPACDLIPRNDKFKPGHRILLARIDSEDEIVGKGKVKSSSFGHLRDNRLPYYHWLPPTKFFEGGFLDFRNLRTLTNEEFDKKFEKPSIQISPFFVKDIVARFSSFYARQGEPDIDEGAKKALIASLKEKDAAQ